jgi:hypothetical protein
MPRYLEEVRLKKALGATALRLMAELMVGPTTMVGASLLAAGLFWAGALRMISRLPGSYGELVRGSWHAALLAFGIQVPLACGLTLAIALAPALGLLRDDGAPRSGYSSTVTRHSGRLLQVIVTLQIAFCIGTGILAGMVVTSLFNLMQTPLGYDPEHLVVVHIGMSSGSMEMRSTDDIARALTIQNLQERVEAVPGVRSASYGDPPFESEKESGGTSALSLLRLDKTTASPHAAYQKDIGPGYFHTLGTRIIRGTDISLHGSGNEIVINETLAKELWPNDNPVGRSVRLIYPAASGMPSFTKVATIVGIVENMRYRARMETPHPTIYVSIMGGGFMDFGPHIIVNGTESMHSLEAVVSPFVAAQMPGMKVDSIYSVADRERASLLPEKRRVSFVLTVALVMAVVAYIGLFGVLTYYVNTRRRELAIRICFGATPWAVRKIILARSARSAVLAVLLSVPLWPVLARLSSNDYLGRLSWSSGQAVLIALACVLVSVLVALVPATAAASVSPSEVLKEQ